MALIRKTVSIDALPGLAIETILLVPFAVGYLIWCEVQGIGRARAIRARCVDALLLAGGVVTSVPLFLFAYGARRVPYSTIGVLQFIAPSLQLAVRPRRIRRAIRIRARDRLRAHLDRPRDLRGQCPVARAFGKACDGVRGSASLTPSWA